MTIGTRSLLSRQVRVVVTGNLSEKNFHVSEVCGIGSKFWINCFKLTL